MNVDSICGKRRFLSPSTKDRRLLDLRGRFALQGRRLFRRLRFLYPPSRIYLGITRLRIPLHELRIPAAANVSLKFNFLYFSDRNRVFS